MGRQVVLIEQKVSRGTGDRSDPKRQIVEYYTVKGVLVAAVDPLAPQYRADGTWVVPALMQIERGALRH